MVRADTAVRNRGWALEPLDSSSAADASIDEVLAVRGYRLAKHETAALVLEPNAGDGPYVVTTDAEGQLVQQ